MELRPTEKPSTAPTITSPPSLTFSPTPAPSQTMAHSPYFEETLMPTPLFDMEDEEISADRARNAILYPGLVATFMISVVTWITIRDKLRQRKHVRKPITHHFLWTMQHVPLYFIKLLSKCIVYHYHVCEVDQFISRSVNPQTRRSKITSSLSRTDRSTARSCGLKRRRAILRKPQSSPRPRSK